MYLTAGGLFYGAGHESAGIRAPETQWFFAEGATGDFFDLFILIGNPNPRRRSHRDLPVRRRHDLRTRVGTPSRRRTGRRPPEPLQHLGGRPRRFPAVRAAWPMPPSRPHHDRPPGGRGADDVVAGPDGGQLGRGPQRGGRDHDRHAVGPGRWRAGRAAQHRDLHPDRQHVRLSTARRASRSTSRTARHPRRTPAARPTAAPTSAVGAPEVDGGFGAAVANRRFGASSRASRSRARPAPPRSSSSARCTPTAPARPSGPPAPTSSPHGCSSVWRLTWRPTGGHKDDPPSPFGAGPDAGSGPGGLGGRGPGFRQKLTSSGRALHNPAVHATRGRTFASPSAEAGNDEAACLAWSAGVPPVGVARPRSPTTAQGLCSPTT